MKIQRLVATTLLALTVFSATACAPSSEQNPPLSKSPIGQSDNGLEMKKESPKKNTSKQENSIDKEQAAIVVENYYVSIFSPDVMQEYDELNKRLPTYDFKKYENATEEERKKHAMGIARNEIKNFDKVTKNFDMTGIDDFTQFRFVVATVKGAYLPAEKRGELTVDVPLSAVKITGETAVVHPIATLYLEGKEPMSYDASSLGPEAENSEKHDIFLVKRNGKWLIDVEKMLTIHKLSEVTW